MTPPHAHARPSPSMPADRHDHVDDHDGGLEVDLPRLQAQLHDRRRALRWLAGAGMGLAGGLPLVACGGGGDGTTSSTGTTAGSTTTTTGSGSTSGTTTTGSSTTVSSCATIPEETAGPYPADGSNTSNGGIANALALSGIVRSDIRSSIGGVSGTAAGVPLTVTLRLVNTSASCADLSGYAVYLWHCDRDGNYSMYAGAALAQNYLRGVQSTGSNGEVTFTTIFPGCYSGRMPHIHFEIYRNASAATTANNKIRTSQLALPTDVCSAVYATTGYASSATNLARITFATDNVFSDGVSLQLAGVAGNVSAGYAATLTVGIVA